MCDLYKLRTCRPCCIADHFIDNTMKWNEMKRMTRTTRRRANEWKRKKQQRIGWKIMWMGEAYKICAISRSIAHFWVIKLTHTNTYISFSPANNFTSRLSDYHLHIFLVIFIVRWCLGGFATCDKWGEKACTRKTEKKSETSAFFLPYYEKKMSIYFSVTDVEMYTIFIIFIANILYNTFYADVWRHMFCVLKSCDLCAIFTFALFYLLPIYLFLIFSISLTLTLTLTVTLLLTRTTHYECVGIFITIILAVFWQWCIPISAKISVNWAKSYALSKWITQNIFIIIRARIHIRIRNTVLTPISLLLWLDPKILVGNIHIN